MFNDRQVLFIVGSFLHPIFIVLISEDSVGEAELDMNIKHTSTLRVLFDVLKNDEEFNNLMVFLQKHRRVVDRVALLHATSHMPVQLETLKGNIDIFAERIKTLHEAGFSAGINVTATVGHHPQFVNTSFQGNYIHMTNHEGETCLGSYCMNDRRYLDEYVKPLYLMLLSAEPDFIWVDDDVRFNHYPIGVGCYCDRCIEKFNRDYGFDFTRFSLTERLADSNETELRKKWLSHQSDKIENLLRFIADVVYSQTDKVKLGMMSGERYCEGFRFEGWAKALSDNGAHKIMWRPGGGAYNDLDFRGFTVKSNEIGRQVANLPDYVDEIQSEIESFPYQQLKKSGRSTTIESIMYLASGCNGTTWNVLPGYAGSGESVALVDNIFNEVEKSFNFMQKLSLDFVSNTPLGIHDGWHPNGQSVVYGNFFGDYGGAYADTMTELELMGLPHAYNFKQAACYLLRGRQPLAYSDDEIMYMLSKGVYMDTEALDILRGLGYEDYVGFKRGKPAPADVSEVYAPHPLNEGIVGKKRTCFAVFSGCQATDTLILPQGGDILCSLEDENGHQIAPCTMGLFQNKLGGTVIVSGYYPWQDLVDSQKSMQLKNIFRLLMKEYPLCYVSSYHRIRVVVRQTESGMAAILFNGNHEELSGVELFASVDKKHAYITDENCNEVCVDSIRTESDGNFFSMPTLRPYQFYLVNFK